MSKIDLGTVAEIVARLTDHRDRTAVMAFTDEGTKAWRYSELGDAAGRLAAGLRDEGVEPGELVGLYAPNSPEWMAVALGIIGAGAAVVPIDAQSSQSSLDHVLADTGLQRVFTTRDLAGRLAHRQPDTPLTAFLLDVPDDHDRSWRRLTGQEVGPLDMPVNPDDLVVIFYTSGTTGPPKGVPVTHGSLAFSINAFAEVGLVGGDDRIFLPLPLHHAYPFSVGMLAPLAMGLSVVLPGAITGPEVQRALQEGRPTTVLGVPRLYDALLSGLLARVEEAGPGLRTLLEGSLRVSGRVSGGPLAGLSRHLLAPIRRRIGPEIRMVASGGSALSRPLAEQLRGLGWSLATGYGLTEATPILTWNLPWDFRLGTAGRPVPGVDLRIDHQAPGLSSREGSDAGSGEVAMAGEILCRGPNVFHGYRNLPDETAKAFTDDGWFRTGDLGYFDADGYLHIAGRVSTLIITQSGEKVQPQEVESVYESHSAIDEIGVLEQDGRLAALVVPDSDIDAEDTEAVRAILGEALDEAGTALATYQRVTEFAVTPRPLPRTRLGKIQRHKLAARYAEARTGDQARGEPVDPHEMSAADRELLRHDAARTAWEILAGRFEDRHLSPDTRPRLDLGVDSLGWVDLTLAIQERTGVELGERAIARVETVRDLLEAVIEADTGDSVDESGGEAVDPVAQPRRVLTDEQAKWLEPLSSGQRRLAWGLYHLNRLVMRSVFRVRGEGLDRLPKDKQIVIAPNHESFLDAFALAATLPWPILDAAHWGGWTGIAFGNPVTRRFSRLAKGVPLDPEAGFMSSLAFGAAVLAQGNNLIWFPEGSRSETGELQPFRPGLGRLLDHYEVWVVPVGVSGAYEAMPPGAWLPKPRQILVRFGQPLDPRDLDTRGEGHTPEDRMMDALRDEVAELI